MGTVKRWAESSGLEYRLIDRPIPRTRLGDYRWDADLFRLQYSALYPDLLYFDADILVERPGLDKLLDDPNPYFMTIGSMPDMACFYTAKKPEFFSDLLQNQDDIIGWPQNHLNQNRNGWNSLPKNFIQHLSLGRMLINDNLREYGCSKFKVIRNLDNSLSLEYRGQKLC